MLVAQPVIVKTVQRYLRLRIAAIIQMAFNDRRIFNNRTTLQPRRQQRFRQMPGHIQPLGFDHLND